MNDAANCRVKLAIENIDGLPCDRLSQIVACWDPCAAGICFDSSHATYGGRFFSELEHLAARVIGTHLSDNDGLQGGLRRDCHWRPFKGIIDWERLVRTLVHETPCTVLIVEALSEGHQIIPELLQSLSRLQNLVNSFVRGERHD